MDANPLPATPDPRLWRRHLIGRQTAAMARDPRLDPQAAKALSLPDVLGAARSRFPVDYPKIAAALGASPSS